MLVITVNDASTDEVIDALQGQDFQYMNLVGFAEEEFPLRVLVESNGDMDII